MLSGVISDIKCVNIRSDIGYDIAYNIIYDIISIVPVDSCYGNRSSALASRNRIGTRVSIIRNCKAVLMACTGPAAGPIQGD